MIFRALSLAFSQMGDPRILRVFVKSVIIALILCVALGFGLAQGALWLLERYAPEWSGDATRAVLIVGGVGLAMLAFRAVAIPVTGFFGDEVVAAIEAKHYPSQSDKAVPAPISLSLRLGLASASRVILINLAALPAYVFLIFTAIGPALLFMGINAVLLGRDLAEMVAVRHLDAPARKQWVANNRFDFALLGLIVTGLFLVPGLNLLAPIIGAGAATHLFHKRSLEQFRA